jgi:hypothetical protein
VKNLAKKLTVCALLSTCWLARAQNVCDLCLDQLKNTQVFAFGGTGFAGRISEGEKDFNYIMALPAAQAVTAFELVLSNGNPQARAYALEGLHKLDQTRFTRAQTNIKGSGAKVRTMSGCIVEEKLLRKLATEIASGKYDPWVRASGPPRVQ